MGSLWMSAQVLSGRSRTKSGRGCRRLRNPLTPGIKALCHDSCKIGFCQVPPRGLPMAKSRQKIIIFKSRWWRIPSRESQHVTTIFNMHNIQPGRYPVSVYLYMWLEEILHHLVTIGNIIQHCKSWDYNGILPIYQLVQDFATIHSGYGKSPLLER